MATDDHKMSDEFQAKDGFNIFSQQQKTLMQFDLKVHGKKIVFMFEALKISLLRTQVRCAFSSSAKDVSNHISFCILHKTTFSTFHCPLM